MFEQEITEIINSGSNSAIEILEELKKRKAKISKATLNRELTNLIQKTSIYKTGSARATRYYLSSSFKLLADIKVEEYFKTEPDLRNINPNFNFEVFENIQQNKDKILSKDEIKYLSMLNKEFQEHKKKLSEVIIRKEFERLTIDLAWKSSRIEGNTYSLVETETLIKTGIEAKGHQKEEAAMILNHKHALDYIRENPKEFTHINKSKIIELHSLLIRDLGISKNIRNSAVGITGTKYRPLTNKFQIEEAVDITSNLINEIENPILKSIVASALLSYIQAFEDGNKRTSRMTANALLMGFDYCPLSYRSVSETDYKNALLLFYEQNNINYLKKLIFEQFEFAVKNYWQL